MSTNIQLDIHNDIKTKLNEYIKNNTIPNIIFHGPTGSGKKTLLEHFLSLIYKKDNLIKENCLYVDCAKGVGIKFIREELKNFAKTQIINGQFKSIILLNAEKLTIDAQSSLRRCIEIFNHNTRFFIVLEDKYKLLKPIISRFSDIYIEYPIIDNKMINLYELKKLETLNIYERNKEHELHKNLITYFKKSNNKKKKELFDIVETIYNKGFSGYNLLKIIDNNLESFKINETDIEYLKFKINIEKVCKETKNEQLVILSIIKFILFRYNVNLENIYIF
jgi:DNA polymerase III delta prime subunit